MGQAPKPAIVCKGTHLNGRQQQNRQWLQLSNGVPTAPMVAYQEVEEAPRAHKGGQKGHHLQRISSGLACKVSMCLLLMLPGHPFPQMHMLDSRNMLILLQM